MLVVLLVNLVLELIVLILSGSRVHLDLHPTVSTASTYVANTIHVDLEMHHLLELVLHH